MVAEWITAIATAVLTLGVFLAYFQMRADHERCRREKAVDLLMHFDLNLDASNSTARKLVEKLDRKQCEKLFNQEEFEIDGTLRDYAEGAMRNKCNLPSGQSKVQLDKNQSSIIRWSVVKYLNLIETICVAWHNNIADKSIIEEQLKYVYNPQKNELALTNFREIAGKDGWPCFDALVVQLKQEYEEPKKGKGKVA